MGSLRTTKPVNRGAPCPICNKPTWCLVARDGSYAVCYRIESSQQAFDGIGWVHHLGGSSGSSRYRDRSWEDVVIPTGAGRAPPDRIHKVLSRLLATLTLGSAHRKQLEDRGDAAVAAEARGYRTLPQKGRDRLCRNLAEQERLEGVPGFFITKRGCWELWAKPGLLIPARGPDGKLRGLRIRPDNPGDGGKYRWLSSAKQKGGAGSDAHCHVARPPGKIRDPALWITEGEVKADLSALWLGAVVLSVPGVDLWTRYLPDLTALLPGGGRVVVALDSDWRKKAAVHRALWGLSRTAQALGYETEVALWHKHKGLDDLLHAGAKLERCPIEVIPPPPWPAGLKRTGRRLAEMASTTTAEKLPLQEAREALATALRRNPTPAPCG